MLIQIASVYVKYDDEIIPVFADINEKRHKRIVETKLKNMVKLVKKIKASENLEAVKQKKTAEQIASAGGANANHI